jgi:hypothetical protein
MSLPAHTRPLQTTYPQEFIDRVIAAIPGNGRLHTELTWNMSGIEEHFIEELLKPEYSALELKVIQELYHEHRRLCEAAGHSPD